ncbi:MAG: redox-regulated ATPase YchF [bacterium]|nr:redox-regulated ATPase YchF [bacterium]
MLSIGIVGLPNVGKSTLFKALTKKQIDISNYPFTTIDPTVGVVAVPDERLDILAKLSNSKKIVPTAIEFIDIAGLIKGAAEGEGLGNKFLANIREADAIAQVVRVFEDKNITHVHNKIDPKSDIEVIRAELILADLQTVEKRLEANARKLKSGDKDILLEQELLQKILDNFQKEIPVYQLDLNDKEWPIVDTLSLLTSKKTIFVFNASEEQVKNGWKPTPELLQTMGPSEYVVLSANFELLISEAEKEERDLYLSEMGLTRSGLDELIISGYKLLNLIAFLTTGEDETRAWTAPKGAFIPQASRAIHTDFEKLFIRAEVVNWQELVKAGSWGKARENGTLKLVGRDYIIQEGDVVEIKI